jgi:hypothetical protein
MKLRQLRVDRLSEFSDLVLIAHIDRNRNRPATAPVSFPILPCVVVQVIRRALISAAYVDQVA